MNFNANSPPVTRRTSFAPTIEVKSVPASLACTPRQGIRRKSTIHIRNPSLVFDKINDS